MNKACQVEAMRSSRKASLGFSHYRLYSALAGFAGKPLEAHREQLASAKICGGRYTGVASSAFIMVDSPVCTAFSLMSCLAS